MRSGSTLLKALLGESPEVSHLGEADFQRFQGEDAERQIFELAPEPVVLLKRPAWFNEIGRYPRFPNTPAFRCVILIRDVVPTVHSLQKMTFRKLGNTLGPIYAPWMAKRYWAGITERLLTLHRERPETTCLIRYEDLTDRPIEETKRLFAFMGLPEQPGVDSYSTPEGQAWRWGSDDGGEVIKTMRVQPARTPKPARPRLAKVVENDERIVRLRSELGYC